MARCLSTLLQLLDLSVQSVAGTVANFPLGAVFGRGGRLVAGGTLTHDGGSGPDDYTVFVTSEGEVAVYAGSNPGNADEWAKVGCWFVGEPVGDRPLDPTLEAMVQAAREALTNAAKFAGAERVDLYAEVQGEHVQIYVRDRGVGFDPRTVPPDRSGVRPSL